MIFVSNFIGSFYLRANSLLTEYSHFEWMAKKKSLSYFRCKKWQQNIVVYTVTFDLFILKLFQFALTLKLPEIQIPVVDFSIRVDPGEAIIMGCFIWSCAVCSLGPVV